MGFWGPHCTLAIVSRADCGEVNFLKCICNRGEVDLHKKKRNVITSPASPHHRPSSGINNQKLSSVARREVHQKFWNRLAGHIERLRGPRV